ncbi:hypothetical protein ACIQAA_21045 [Neobacillus sp. NPDC093182]|uniref:DUF2264 C-terminal domain-containing protein n=1 Tax=Neobacillus sp. NPDC093182 TaxID=3364297 RepID=UPI00382B65EB
MCARSCNKEYKGQTEEVSLNKQESFARLPWGASGIRSIYGNGQPDVVYPNANTNLLNPRTVIPTVKGSLKPGTHWLVNAVFGIPGSEQDLSLWDMIPQVEFVEDEIIIRQGTETVVIQKEAVTT